MKNPIILKDLLIWSNSVIWKSTIIISLFIFCFIIIATYDFTNININYRYNLWRDFYNIAYYPITFGLLLLWFIKWIISVAQEKSAATYELIFISKITAFKYIFWKYIANLLFFVMLIVLALPFFWMMTFAWGVSFSDIISVSIHYVLFISGFSALWILAWLIWRKTTLWLLIGGLWFITIWFIIAFFNELNPILDIIIGSYYNRYDYTMLDTWLYKIIFFTIITCFSLIYSIQYIKEETVYITNRYPISLSVLLYCFWLLNIIILDFNVIYTLLIISLIDIILYFVNTKNLSNKNYKKIAYHFLGNISVSIGLIIFFEWWLFNTFIYYILVLFLLLLVSLVVNIFYRSIQYYIQKLVFILTSLFILILFPSIINDLDIKIGGENFHISSIEKTLNHKINYDLLLKTYIQDPSNSTSELLKTQKWVKHNMEYIIFMIIFFSILFVGVHNYTK